ncbi:P-loop containing nucleoside triphosphate hydrolase protein [Phycomyces blakesleeanus]|uniref:DNA 3'-5' helicase n=1 Tax=Phycomyces blakesleeanus TaxID=4837 RepID=A0ABR3AP99_PHYBL
MGELDFLNQLVEIQYNAATSNSETLQILAVPGSGKTRVLTSRIAWLIIANELEPRSIVAVTFTNKAAKEMKERLCSEALLGSKRTEELMIGTFHSVCSRLIRKYPHYCGLKGNFMIANPEKSRDIINKIIYTLRLAKVEGSNKPDVYFNEISKARNKGLDVKKYADLHSSSPNKQNTINVFRAYEKELLRLNYVDFDSLMVIGRDLLVRHPELMNGTEHILVDEFQDTNTIQYQILKAMAYGRKKVTVVGDPDQSVFGWRDGDPANFAKMHDDFSGINVIHMSISFRSSGSIIEAAGSVVRIDPSRDSRSCRTDNLVGMPVKVLVADDGEGEADMVARQIIRVRDESKGLFDYNDFAVLVRTNYLTRNFEQAFMLANIPCVVVGGPQFVERAEVKDILGYLIFCFNPEDFLSFEKIVNVPNRGINDATIQYLRGRCLEDGINVIDVIKMITGRTPGPPPRFYLSTKVKSSLTELLYLFEDIKQQLDTKIFSIILDLTDYREYLRKEFAESFVSRWENVGELVTYASVYISELSTRAISPDQDPIIGFLEAVALGPEQLEPNEVMKGKVTISTLHNSKGLEWPCVFVAACEEGVIPHSRVDSKMEESRLLYVGMTRAKCLLYCSYARTRMGWSNVIRKYPSSFLTDLIRREGSKIITPIDVEMLEGYSKLLKRPLLENDAVEESHAILSYPATQEYSQMSLCTQSSLSLSTQQNKSIIQHTSAMIPEDPFSTLELSFHEIEMILDAPDSPIPSPTHDSVNTLLEKRLQDDAEESHEENSSYNNSSSRSSSNSNNNDNNNNNNQKRLKISDDIPKISPELTTILKECIIRCVKEAGNTRHVFVVGHMGSIVKNELKKDGIYIPYEDICVEVKELLESLVDSGDMIYTRHKKNEKYTIAE